MNLLSMKALQDIPRVAGEIGIRGQSVYAPKIEIITVSSVSCTVWSSRRMLTLDNGAHVMSCGVCVL